MGTCVALSMALPALLDAYNQHTERERPSTERRRREEAHSSAVRVTPAPFLRRRRGGGSEVRRPSLSCTSAADWGGIADAPRSRQGPFHCRRRQRTGSPPSVFQRSQTVPRPLLPIRQPNSRSAVTFQLLYHRPLQPYELSDAHRGGPGESAVGHGRGDRVGSVEGSDERGELE